MKITRENYEIFFIDFLDGNMSSSDKAMLQLFLVQNPDLAQELEGIESVILEPQQAVFKEKELLKKTDFAQTGITSTIDYLSIADAEGDITDAEKTKLEELVKSNKKNTETRDLYRRLKLKPDLDIKFSNKSNLKRVPIIQISQNALRNITSVAAALGLLIGVYALVKINSINTQPQFVQQENVGISIKPTRSQVIIEQEVSFEQQEWGAEMQPKKLEQINVNEIEETILLEINKQQENDQFALASINPVPAGNLKIKQLKPEAIWDRPEAIANTILEQQVTTELFAQSGQSRTIGIFELAQMGIQRFAEYTGANISLDAEKSPDGTIEKIQFETTLFAVSRPVKRR